MPTLGLDNLTKTFNAGRPDQVHAVLGVSLRINDGTCCVLTGASGCGKTTLIMMISGLVQPTQGDIVLGTRSLIGVRPDARNIAIAFQHDALYPHLTVRKHLVRSLKNEGVARADLGQRIGSVVDALGIADCIDRKPGALSGGQRRRVSLARAMVREVDLLMLDEPFSGLDPGMGDQVCALLRERFARDGVTALVVTHNHERAGELAEQVVSMHNGRIDPV